jgi:hypothetical protein
LYCWRSSRVENVGAPGNGRCGELTAADAGRALRIGSVDGARGGSLGIDVIGIVVDRTAASFGGAVGGFGDRVTGFGGLDGVCLALGYGGGLKVVLVGDCSGSTFLGECCGLPSSILIPERFNSWVPTLVRPSSSCLGCDGVINGGSGGEVR